MDNNTNNSNSSVKLNVHYWEQILVSVPIGLIAIAGIIGNSMIIAAVSFSRKLQTSTNAFVINLAIADLLTSIFLIFYVIGALGLSSYPLKGVEWLCALTAFMIYSCRGTSLYTLAGIAVNRLILITRPSLYRKIFVSWKLGILLAIPWILIWGSSIVIIFQTGFSILGYDEADLACAIKDSNENAENLTITLTLIAFPIPILVTMISYLWIYIYLKRYFRSKKRQIAICPGAGSMNALHMMHLKPISSGQYALPSNESGHTVTVTFNQRERISKKQIEITKNLFMVVCSLCICFLPNCILIFVPNHSYILFYTRVLTLSNSAVNFAIYALKHPDFRIIFRHMCKCSIADIPEPSRFLKFLHSKEN